MSARAWCEWTIALAIVAVMWSGIAVGFFMSSYLDDPTVAGWAAAFTAVLTFAGAFYAFARGTTEVPS